MQWESASSRQIAAVSRKTVVVLPVGAVEQRGPHLPTGTDSILVASIARRLDEALGGRLLVLPTQKVGFSAHHLAFGGTLTLTHETFLGLLLEEIECVVGNGFRRLLLLNGHGGNQAIGEVTAQKAMLRWPELEVVFTSWWRVAANVLADLVEGEFPSVGHACEFETSLMLHLKPELVRLELARNGGLPPAAPQLRSDLFTRTASASMPLPFDRLTTDGVFGRPTLASAAKGEKILERVIESLCNLLNSCWPDQL